MKLAIAEQLEQLNNAINKNQNEVAFFSYVNTEAELDAIDNTIKNIPIIGLDSRGSGRENLRRSYQEALLHRQDNHAAGDAFTGLPISVLESKVGDKKSSYRGCFSEVNSLSITQEQRFH